ncbi:hypothetical protein CCAL13119_03035 [Campylobacter sp. RM13119]|uniref:Uncharacterized protein n=1 Tax=Campylobacter californiensis TaxID=1032243 RepID=A0AAW3ZXS3_9BACT|nr:MULTISPECIES: hypothetical protein [unclassified Campylobacter]MBE2984162.1 hypothetical protein [Campylobacter sp. RM6883]MBE2986214.1 hypothetical protein [Campylobacter sp. RM12919]MBE2988211.1 hypothetical protein [Campylobacter sp. RM12920]MBE3022631.1 hypothetical protein [Campylobacter sp. 7477a]MBE3607785.1 hypothetical protein [Campylobacter sp. RM9337]
MTAWSFLVPAVDFKILKSTTLKKKHIVINVQKFMNTLKIYAKDLINFNGAKC